MSARILKQIEEEQKIVDILAAAYEGDKKFWWEIVKELRHDARGKPLQRIATEKDHPLEINVNIRRIGA